ncbi:DNA-binding transcriptional repressor DeoR [Citrobacter sp. JGM124]|uniref:DNA-binding transcriptional repressor DeoR n=1 Tax=Citrobacter sp. JGM124 TaxID=2799789 RepID=UPI001BAA9A60|nr:DNA-binding transcriptional repressor DeoR [Citrobacter sp. JGM124]MBS0847913.1 DNA-binding transcriptional repressor DeoR [Citrobacter sp. JGM124]
METRRNSRMTRLMQELKQNDKIHLKDAAGLLGVSEMTIRRDLSDNAGPLMLLGGYIVIEPRASATSHYLLNDQQALKTAEKRHAAKLAAGLVRPHQTVFFDCGTTMPYIIEALDDALPFTGLCYSLNTFLVLQKKPLCRVILSGGEFHASNAIFKPINFQECLNNLCPDIAFLSAAGVDVRQGVTCFNLEELPVKQWALAMAQERVLVVDDSKFDQTRAACMGPLTAFDRVITNKRPAEAFVEYASAENLSLLW